MMADRKPITILLVEDDDGHARLLERNLRRGGIVNRLVRVSDGQEAVDYLERVAPYADEGQYPLPGVIFLDVRMPRLDGFEVLGRIKSNHELRTIPVIMVTSTDNQREIDRAYELGANGYVVKPVNMEAFMDRVVRLGMFVEVIELPAMGGQNGASAAGHPAS